MCYQNTGHHRSPTLGSICRHQFYLKAKDTVERETDPVVEALPLYAFPYNVLWIHIDPILLRCTSEMNSPFFNDLIRAEEEVSHVFYIGTDVLFLKFLSIWAYAKPCSMTKET